MKRHLIISLLLQTTSNAFHLPRCHTRIGTRSTKNSLETQLQSTSQSSASESTELQSQNVQSPSQHPETQTQSAQNQETHPSYKRDLRAGEEGYSLLRRPVDTSFDESDPIFDAPRLLIDDDDVSGGGISGVRGVKDGDVGSGGGGKDLLGDYAALSTDTSDTSDTSVSSGDTKLMGTKKKRQREQDQSLDMHQRTLETLDYRLVVKALSEECGTVGGRQIVWDSIGVSKNKIGKRSKSDEDVANMPLTASTLQGVHRRYTALKEMQALMDGRVTGWITPIHSKQAKQSESTTKKSESKPPKKKKPKLKPLNTPPITGMSFDLEPISEMLDRNEVLEGPEILEITEILECCMEVLDWGEALKVVNAEIEQHQQQSQQGKGVVELQQQSFSELIKYTSSITINPELYTLLSTAFDNEGRLSGTTFPTIGLLRSQVKSLKSSILSSIDSILSSPSIQNKLALESGGSLTMEINGRLVIPLQRSYSNMGIVHDASRSGKTAYVEPMEIVGPTNELRQKEAELRLEESKVWRELTKTIIKYWDEIETNVAIISQLDVVLARVKLGKRLEGVIPQVGDEGVVSVREARHPILLLRGIEDVVGSDVELGVGDNRGLILTGPNSGGKTVILKLLGLYAFMVRDGIPVPSKTLEEARVDFFEPILADIGDLQSVDGDLSTFSGHMLVCREVLNNAQQNALVLMDELGSGTDPNQGVAIARALLEALLDRGCRVAITTHYMELKQLASSDSRFAVAGMQFLGGVPTYKLIPGMIGESFAIAVAERLKLPESVIMRANELLDSDTRKMGELIQNLEDQKLLVEQKGEELKKREVEMFELKAEMKRQQERLEAKQLNARREEAQKFAAKLDEKERLLEDILEKLKGSGATKKVVADSWSNIRIVKREALNEAENLPGVMSRMQQQQSQVELIPISEMKEFPDLNIDDNVVVCKKGAFYGKEGTIQQVGKKVQVAVDGISVRLTLKEIALPPTGESPQNKSTKQLSREEATIAKLSKRGIDLESEDEVAVDVTQSGKSRDTGVTMKMTSNTVNCIGNTFEESKRKCIDGFSKAALSNRSVVFILHGHGTGVLKQKIRSWLSSDRQWVKSFGPAEQADGGEALTKVILKKQNLF